MKNELLELVDELLETGDEIQQKAYLIYQENLDHFSNGDFDTGTIDNDKDIARYKRKEYLKIASVDTQHLDVDKVKAILKGRKKTLDFYLNTISLDNIGTTLNMLRELYHDILIDFERNVVL